MKAGAVRKGAWVWQPVADEVSRRGWQPRESVRTGWHLIARPGVAPGDWLKRLALDSERQLRKGACSESLHAVFNIKSRLTCKRPRVLRECKSSRLAAGGWTPERDKRSRSASASGRRLKQSMTVVWQATIERHHHVPRLFVNSQKKAKSPKTALFGPISKTPDTKKCRGFFFAGRGVTTASAAASRRRRSRGRTSASPGQSHRPRPSSPGGRTSAPRSR